MSKIKYKNNIICRVDFCGKHGVKYLVEAQMFNSIEEAKKYIDSK